MWLLPIMTWVADLACRLFYRFHVEGPRPPSDGPLLLVANHQNSLFDPALVAAAAERPVRFLAKSTLFNDRRVGWLVKASGSIPVYRTHEVKEASDRNLEMFAAVFEQLGLGAAIGIFPEGTSHSEPSLVPLKTGAARMALGFGERSGEEPLAIVPVGLLLRDKGVFRSSALALRAGPIEWSDLAGRVAEDREAVRELTSRIEAALREVTVNLERWDDRPLVETVEAIWTASRDPDSERVERVHRSRLISEILGRLRRRGGEDWISLANRVSRHRDRLARLGLRPIDLSVKTDLASGLRWAVRRVHFLLPLAIVHALAGYVLFLPPYLLTDLIIRVIDPEEDQRSTYKALIAVPVYLAWILCLWSIAWALGGGWLGVAVLLAAPLIGVSGLIVRERLKASWSDVRQFFTLKSREPLLIDLRAAQSRLADDLAALHERLSTSPGSIAETAASTSSATSAEPGK